jgi:uncharacterized circularly permuted ATP-grasp superfamily protein
VAAVRAGMVTVANALGSGILETGALLGYLPRLCEHLLGQQAAHALGGDLVVRRAGGARLYHRQP